MQPRATFKGADRRSSCSQRQKPRQRSGCGRRWTAILAIPAILLLAAQYEQARGDNERAADYYRASLAVMPQASPVDRLAHVLVYPEQDNRPHRQSPRPISSACSNPDEEPFAKTTKLPPLPAYGIDPYNGTAPVILNRPVSQPRQAPQPNAAHAELSRLQHRPAHQRHSEPCCHVHPFGKLAGAVISTASAARFERRNRRHAPRPAHVSSSATSPPACSPAPARSAGPPITGEISADPPHSLASDAYKGLIFSLIADKKYPEAIQELARVPPDVRPSWRRT